MIFKIILLLIFTKSEASLKLVFSDEFNEGESLDLDKWDVIHEARVCNGNWLNQLNCKTNSTDNLRVIDGTLAIAPLRQKHLDKFYTSPMITTKQNFTFGRFEMRAALPKGKMLRPIIFLHPVTTSGWWPRDGEVDIITFNQTQELQFGIHYVRNEEEPDIVKKTNVSENLNDFQTYILVWTQSEITFILNNRTLHTINIKEKLANIYNPFIKEFKIRISLGIGGNDFFPGQILYEKDVEEWPCPLLMFDYIRVYQNMSDELNPSTDYDTEGQEQNIIPSTSGLTSSDVCLKVLPLIRPRKPKWKLIFSDEFNGTNLIDQDNWEVEQEDNFCDENGQKELNCNTNSTRNVRLTDGTLVLAAIREKHLTKEFTAPLITTKKSFTIGKFEVRAALPEGKMLRPVIYMAPIEIPGNQTNILNLDRMIKILSNRQSKEIEYGIYYTSKAKKQRDESVSQITQSIESLFNFHRYTMEWTETEIRWFFDDKHLYTTSLLKEFSEAYNLFNIPLRIVISLGVGGDGYFPGKVLKDEDADNWPCSLFILDYIRVYEMSDTNITNYSLKLSNITSNEICQYVMPQIRVNSKGSSVSLTLIISMSILLLLLALVPLNIYLFIRFKKPRKASRNSELYDMPDDNQPELYDGVYDISYSPQYEAIDYQGAEYNKDEQESYLPIKGEVEMTNQTCNNFDDHYYTKIE